MGKFPKPTPRVFFNLQGIIYRFKDIYYRKVSFKRHAVGGVISSIQISSARKAVQARHSLTVGRYNRWNSEEKDRRHTVIYLLHQAE